MAWLSWPSNDGADVCVNADVHTADLPITTDVPIADLPTNTPTINGGKSDLSAADILDDSDADMSLNAAEIIPSS